jgi:hypothetical protein
MHQVVVLTPGPTAQVLPNCTVQMRLHGAGADNVPDDT